MPNTKSIGIAYEDQYLDGATIVNSTISGTTVTATTGIRAGASNAAITRSTAGSINQFYGTATHTSGDVRGIYARVNYAGAGAGETLRAFSTVAAAQGAGQTTNGAHISLSVNTGGTISGAANALRATLGIAAGVAPGGTLAALQVDSDLDNTATVPTTASFIRFTNSNTKTIANLFNVPAAMVQAKVVADSSHLIKIIASDGTAYYLMATTTAP